jgi:ornithine cyclodeaminase
MKLRILNRADVRQLISVQECITLMHQAFALVSNNQAVQPIRRTMRLPHGLGMLGMMPGHISAPASFGIKVVSVFPGNHGTPYGSHQGAMLLFDEANGALRVVLDGRDITALRTGAASAAATDVLARTDARSMSIYGYGDEAVAHLDALTLVRPFERILICGRSLDKARAFAATHSQRLGLRIDATDDFEAAARADVVTTATAAAEPILMGRWLQPGTHVNVIGSSIPSTAEVDDEALLRARLFTDFTESTLELGGEVRRALQRGVMTPAHIIGCVGDVITGKVAGRTADRDITLFKSLGMASEDLITARYIADKAEAANVGGLVDW